jgi:hypothetical protein
MSNGLGAQKITNIINIRSYKISINIEILRMSEQHRKHKPEVADNSGITFYMECNEDTEGIFSNY